jgi:hypothetical protein
MVFPPEDDRDRAEPGQVLTSRRSPESENLDRIHAQDNADRIDQNVSTRHATVPLSYYT